MKEALNYRIPVVVAVHSFVNSLVNHLPFFITIFSKNKLSSNRKYKNPMAKFVDDGENALNFVYDDK